MGKAYPPVTDFMDPIQQKLFALYLSSLLQCPNKLPSFDDIGFKVFSQTNEDGILLFIFSIVGTSNKRCVEICAGDGIECNTANLITAHGWTGLLIDGDPYLVKIGQDFYRRNRYTYVDPPIFINTWVTRSNVNDLLISWGFAGEIDLLVIDMDGVDYWIWDAIEVTRPRVVMVEYQDILGPEKALTVPYDDNFNAYKYQKTKGHPNCCGASITAFVKLAREKGYRLVGCNRLGYNAFFISQTDGEQYFPEINPIDCFNHPKVLRGMQERFEVIKDFPWVEV
jgi:hypothetical protein